MEKVQSLSLVPSNYLPPKEGNISLIKPGKEFDQNYIINRINLKPIEVDVRVRDAILSTMSHGGKYIQIDDYTVMLNSIASIDPMPKRENSELVKLSLEIAKKESVI